VLGLEREPCDVDYSIVTQQTVNRFSCYVRRMGETQHLDEPLPQLRRHALEHSRQIETSAVILPELSQQIQVQETR
jgi:hypothetical protein